MGIRNKIKDKSASVGVIGLGYVGLPLTVAIAKAGFVVTEIDISQAKIDQIQKGISYIDNLSSETLAPFVEKNISMRQQISLF